MATLLFFLRKIDLLLTTFFYDKFKQKLTAYKANRLSHAARLTLIKSVFASIPVYYMSNIFFSKKFLAKLMAIIRNFWWTGVKDEAITKSLCLRAWADICIEKEFGGLGIRNLQAMNQSLILLAAWRLAKEPHSQLALILKEKYHHDTSIWRAKPDKPKSAFWIAILKVKPLLTSAAFYQIFDGNRSIWNTPGSQSGKPFMIILIFKLCLLYTQLLSKIYSYLTKRLGMQN